MGKLSPRRASAQRRPRVPRWPNGGHGFACRPFGPFGAADTSGYHWIPQALLKASITVCAGMTRRNLCTPTTRCGFVRLAPKP
jgi:hypothetical protein